MWIFRIFRNANDDEFVEKFNKQSQILSETVKIFCDLLANRGNKTFKQLSKQIEDLEHEADTNTREIHELLNKSFITRIDKQDMIQLLMALDDVCDFIDNTVEMMSAWGLDKVRDDALQFGNLLAEMVNIIELSMPYFANLSAKPLEANNVRIKALEDRADKLYKKAIEQLRKDYSGQPVLLIGWWDVFGYLEKTADRAEDVVEILKTIAQKETL